MSITSKRARPRFRFRFRPRSRFRSRPRFRFRFRSRSRSRFRFRFRPRFRYRDRYRDRSGGGYDGDVATTNPPPPVQTKCVPYSGSTVRRAVEILQQGRLVAFPTETVYGLGARADESAPVRAIFDAKGRPAGNPLIVHVATMRAAKRLADPWPEAASKLASRYWPGPLTLVVRARQGEVAPEVTAGGSTVAIRVPEHPVAHHLLELVGLPLAAPSANRSSAISPTTAEHVLKNLDGRVDLILDGGPTGYGVESTIVDVSQQPAVLLRHGAIPLSEIAAIIPIVDQSATLVAENQTAPSPGKYPRHYAPNARVLLLPGADVSAAIAAQRAEGKRVGSLEREPLSPSPEQSREVLPDDPVAFAAGLYAALHRLEDAGCEIIVIAQPPDTDDWATVRDRLRRAAA